MKKLKHIGKSEQCDKGDNQHSHPNESYFDVYERFLEPLRDKKINLLELGVRDWTSLRVWRKYFSEANILGVDINPESSKQKFPGCKVEIMNQDDKEGLDKISNKVGGWDIIIDDASHLNEITKRSFEILWKYIKPNGYYIIEDLGVSYSDLTDLPKKWNALHLDKNNPTRNNKREVLNNLFFDLIKKIDLSEGDVRSVKFFHQMVVIQKV